MGCGSDRQRRYAGHRCPNGLLDTAEWHGRRLWAGELKLRPPQRQLHTAKQRLLVPLSLFLRGRTRLQGEPVSGLLAEPEGVRRCGLLPILRRRNLVLRGDAVTDSASGGDKD